ncbi:phage tail assembly protein [Trinickia fusca]|uniref:Phage tail assembly protein n=1 Tax=Trinickia fusca TaxID=2419777 RepID=A0A494XL99_9BURK|nr:phage tail assembly protein [Trinickia fusca]RKP50511.1 phage tail assembly protein [Trinickia fusca]
MSKRDIPDELVVELGQPITMSGGDDSTTYTELVLREPNVSQLSQFIKKTQKENAVDAMKFLISAVADVPLPVMERVGVRDFYKAQQYLVAFITPPDEDDPEGNAGGSQ